MSRRQYDASPDDRVCERAATQHGAISRGQAVDAGLTSRQIDRRVTSRRWARSRRGVYVIAGSPDTWQRAAVVACLAGPAGTVASHTTAAALLGLMDPPDRPHVTVPPSGSGRLPGVSVHHAPLLPGDTCLVQGTPCTTPSRTLVDCAAVVDEEALCGLVDAAFHRRLSTPAKVRAAINRASRAPGRRGTRALERAMAIWSSGAPPGSPAEARILRRLAAWGLPPPERQYILRDETGAFVARVDFAWPSLERGLEYDGEAYHGPRHWLGDEDRQARIEALGWRIERADRFDLRPSSTRLRDALRSMLGEAR